MLKICLVFRKSELQYAYKRYACKKKHVTGDHSVNLVPSRDPVPI